MMQNPYNANNQYAKFKTVDFKSLSSKEIVRRLLEGIVLFNKKALMALEHGDSVLALDMSIQGQKIVLHLYKTLNFEKGEDIAESLARLYEYALHQYSVFFKDRSQKQALDDINMMIQPLIAAWV